MKVLIIENEKLLSESIKLILESKGFKSDIVSDGATGLAYAELDGYDLLVIDSMLPDITGCQLVKKLRIERCATPILMLSSHSSIEDRVECLNSGVDYYLNKPFDARELLACVHVLLRRYHSPFDELSFGNTKLNMVSGTLNCDDSSIRLSAKEFDIMRLLLQNPDRNLSKDTILSHVWGYDSNAVENHVEVYIGFLRKKLKLIGSNIRIVAIRRLGYHLESNDI